MKKSLMGGIFLIGALSLSYSGAMADEGALSPQLAVNGGKQFGLIEIHLPLEKEYRNPFDPNEVAVQGHFQEPDGIVTDIDGFIDQDYNISHGEKDARDHVLPRGGPYWAIRFAPIHAGNCSWWVTRKDESGEVSSAKAVIAVEADSKAPGFIRVAPNRTHFQYDSGAAFYPLAVCLAWPVEGGLFDYEKWLSVFSHNGGNAARIWMTWMEEPLERIKTPAGGWDMKTTRSYVKRYVFPDLNERTHDGADDPWSGLGRLDLAAAWRYDYILDLAAKDDIRVMFCQFGTDDFSPEGWLVNPYNKANGGMLETCSDFFSNPEAKAIFKQRLRYVVARYGWSPDIFAWEIFNEVNGVGRHDPKGYPEEASAVWHREMAQYLKQIDPNRHLVTTCATVEMESVDTIPEIDFIQGHDYNFQDSVPVVALQNAAQSAHFGKPHMFGEFGQEFLQRSHSGGPITDPKGIQLQTGLWASLASPGGGTIWPWYWDNYIDLENLWPLWKPVAQFAADVPWNKVQWKPLDGLKIRYTGSASDAPRQTLRIIPPFVFKPATHSFRIDPDGSVQGKLFEMPLYLEKDTSASPLAFEVNYQQAGQFQVQVRCVSKEGARLEICLDGHPLLTKQFDGGAKDFQFQFNGSYTIDVPSGLHSIGVANTANGGLFSAEYEFINYLDPGVAPLKAYGMIGDSSVGVLYLYNQDYTWGNLNESGQVAPVAPSACAIPGVKPGLYDVEIWAPSEGVLLKKEQITATIEGLPLEFPEIKNDLAVKILPVWERK